MLLANLKNRKPFMKLFMIKKYFKSILYVIISTILLVFSICSSFCDNCITCSNQSLSFVRKLSKSDYKCAISEVFFADVDNNCSSLRTKYRDMNNNYGFFRNTMFSFASAVNENKECVRFSTSFSGLKMPDTAAITISDFCDGNTSENGVLYTFPAKLKFVFKYCDINKYLNKNDNGGSYITQSLADAFLNSNDSLNSYEDLLGETFLLSNERKSSICNIIDDNDELVPMLKKYFGGNFIITTDYSMLDLYTLSTTSIILADHLTFKDYINYFSHQNIDYFSMKYYLNGSLSQDSQTSYFENAICNKKIELSPFSLYFLIPFLLLLLILAFLLFIGRNTKINKIIIFSFFIISINLLLVINIVNLFLYSNLFLINMFNNYLSLYCWFCLISTLLHFVVPKYHLNRKLLSIKSIYEIDI